MTILIGLLTALLVVAADDIVQVLTQLPMWLLWSTLIACGNYIYVTVNKQRISLAPALAILAILNLPILLAMTVTFIGTLATGIKKAATISIAAGAAWSIGWATIPTVAITAIAMGTILVLTKHTEWWVIPIVAAAALALNEGDPTYGALTLLALAIILRPQYDITVTRKQKT